MAAGVRLIVEWPNLLGHGFPTFGHNWPIGCCFQGATRSKKILFCGASPKIGWIFLLLVVCSFLRFVIVLFANILLYLSLILRGVLSPFFAEMCSLWNPWPLEDLIILVFLYRMEIYFKLCEKFLILIFHWSMCKQE